MKRIAALLAALLLLATSASSAQVPVPPAGTPVIVVGLSDGLTVLPVSQGVLPLTCQVVKP